MEVPAGELRVLGDVGDVIRAVLRLHYDLFVTLEVIGAEVQLGAGGEEDVSVPQDVTKCDATGVGKVDAVRPGMAVVLREEDLTFSVRKRLVAALRVDVLSRRLSAIPEVFRLAGDGLDRGEAGGASARTRDNHRACSRRRGGDKSASRHLFLAASWCHPAYPFAYFRVSAVHSI